MASQQPAGRRFPRRVYSIGSGPDPRFSLANERTFLAWMRTSMAWLAAGVALEALDLPIAEGLILGLLAPVHWWFGWVATERALRHSHPLPSPGLGVVMAAGTAIAGLLLLIGLLIR